MKNVDKVKTARLSAGYIGSGSVRRQVAPTGPTTPRQKPTTDRGRAGEVLVNEVILDVLDSVSIRPLNAYLRIEPELMFRLPKVIRMPNRSKPST